MTGRLKASFISAFLIVMAASCNNAPQEQAPFPTQQELPAAAPNAAALFQANCASCHALDKDLTGPALKGALARWNNDTTRIKAFIRNPNKMIADGDPYATALFKKWNNTQMLAFPNLTDEELDGLLKMME